jgi:Protein of unknown function (DUF2442)
LGEVAAELAVSKLDSMWGRQIAGDYHMMPILRIVSAEPVIQGVLKITWDDGCEGLVDLRPVIAKGRIFTYLQDRARFRSVQVGEYGHSIYWIDDEGNEIDFGADGLRTTAEKQAALHALAA